MLNVEPSFVHHWRAYGAWSDAVDDYVEHGIMDWMGTPQFQALMKIEEPYEYRDRLTLPKFIVNARAIEFFLPDSSQFYFDELRGEKQLRYVPNTGHSLDKTRRDRERARVLCVGRQRHAASGGAVDVRARRLDQGRDEGAARRRAALAGDESRRRATSASTRSAPPTRARARRRRARTPGWRASQPAGRAGPHSSSS